MNREIVTKIVKESLRDWFKKEKWVRISSSGNIAGPCGTSKNKKNPDRCLPKAKAQSLTKGQRAATAAKKKKAGAKGKTVVKNTKKATVKKEGLWANINAKKKAGKKSSHKNSNAYKDAKKAGKSLKGETKGAPKGHYFTKSGNLVKGRLTKDAREKGARLSDPKDKQRSKVPPVTQYKEQIGGSSRERLTNLARNIGREEFAMNVLEIPDEKVLDMLVDELAKLYDMRSVNENVAPNHNDKAAPYGSGYKKVTKEDLTNLVVGMIHEMKNNKVIFGYDLEAIENVVNHLQSKYKEGLDYELHIQRGDDLPNAITFKNPALQKDYDLNDMLNIAQSDEDRYNAYTDDDLNEKKDDRCTRIAKRKYDTWPSAYASGAVVRCRRGEIWKKEK